nr:unnamed protein product [Callosobruchus analis]
MHRHQRPSEEESTYKQYLRQQDGQTLQVLLGSFTTDRFWKGTLMRILSLILQRNKPFGLYPSNNYRCISAQ